MIKICVSGGRGVMGRLICGAVSENPQAEVSAILEDPGHRDAGDEFYTAPVLTDPDEAAEKSDIIIDFSAPPGTMNLLQAVVDKEKALVIGTTGFSDDQLEKISSAAEKTPVLLSPNMSVGVNLLFKAAKMINSALKDMGYDREIIEAHHKRKADSPSGTAGELLNIISSDADTPLYGRKGAVGPRKEKEVGIHSVRGGGTVGEHTLMWIGEQDRVELTHRAASRKIFAEGALKAALWLHGMEKGKLYGMDDVLK